MAQTAVLFSPEVSSTGDTASALLCGLKGNELDGLPPLLCFESLVCIDSAESMRLLSVFLSNLDQVLAATLIAGMILAVITEKNP